MVTQEEIPYTQEEYKAMVKTIAQLREEKKELLDKACEWLESVNLDYYQIREGVFSKELVIDFRKAMEE